MGNDAIAIAGPPPMALAEQVSEHSDTATAIATVQAKVVVAHQFPRNEAVSYAKLVSVMQRKSFAGKLVEHGGRLEQQSKAFYVFPRGGELIEGPTIHMVREALRCWGNAQADVIEVRRHEPDGDRHGYSEMRAYAWDMESNVSWTIAFHAPHSRHTRNGSYPLTDPRDIYESIMNLGSRRVRTCIEKLLPSWYLDDAVAVGRATMKADMESQPIEERRAKMLARVAEIGVTPAMIARKFSMDIEELGHDELHKCFMMFKAINDGADRGSFFATGDEDNPDPEANDDFKANETAKE